MAVSTIDRVREAELKANEMQEAADLKAEQLLSDAEIRAKELIDQAHQKADDFDRKASQEAQTLANEIVRRRKEQALKDAEALTEKTLKLKQNVINMLIQETLV